MRFSICLPLLLGAVNAISPAQQPLGTDGKSSPEPDFAVYQSEISAYHSIRVKQQNATICNTTVDQYTGWLDVGPRHLFFWYFESQNAASKSPLTLWLTGGPGGSSMLGMLMELGPCEINAHGNGTVYNEYGWNKDSALIFVDQPAGVGFSYLDEGESLPSNSFSSASDMQIFLQMFMNQIFPVHKEGPLVITGESYAGHYLPTLGAEIVRQNVLHPRQPQVPLKSLMIGNGYVSPLDTTYGYWETLCTTQPGVPEPVFNETRCEIMADNMARCISVLQTCYSHPDAAICNAASSVCWDGVVSYYDGESSGGGGRNRFDITRPCEIDDICYKEFDLIEEYLNSPSVFSALGVPKAVGNYSGISMAISDAFAVTGDGGINMLQEVEYLLASQIDVLIYQGNLDLACNTAGAKRWTANLAWKGQMEYTSKELKPWMSVENGKEVLGGTFKEVNIKMVKGSNKTTRFALVTVAHAGHMVPMDRPEVALDMLTKWLGGKSFD